jgi:undecaprenyl-diphosphatase
MNIIESIFFGIVQGLTEFLPISSTAHLTLFGKLLGKISLDHPEQWTAYMAVIQLGTLFAVLLYFAKDIFIIIRDFIRDNLIRPKKIKEQSFFSRQGWMVIVGTIPAGIVGVVFKKQIEGAFTKSLLVIAISLMMWGILLGIAEKVAQHQRDEKHITFFDALIIGIGQVFALIPGASRSGTTITTGLFMGLTRETAARFSFLLSIPAVLASGLLELKDSLNFLTPEMLWSYVIGIAAAFITGYVVIDMLLKFLKKQTTWVFVWYRIALGIILLVFFVV